MEVLVALILVLVVLAIGAIIEGLARWQGWED